MKLYILRHGHAPSLIEARVSSDNERPLSERGRKDVRQTISHLIKQGAQPALVLHSPLRRAVETAAEASALLKLSGKAVEIFPALANTLSGPELYLRLQTRAAGLREILIVGHQPQLGELAAFLSNTTFTLSPAGLIALETSQDSAKALWTINP